MANSVNSINHLSGSTDGKNIKITTTSGTWTLIHTWPTTTTTYHEIWLYATNTGTTNRKLTIQWGWTTSPDDLIEVTIPAESWMMLVIPWFKLKGNATALTVTAIAETANVININWYYHEIT